MERASEIQESDHPERPTYRRTRSIFVRGLGLIYLAAFGSLAVQVDGLIGSRGILPAGEYLAAVRNVLKSESYWQVPTLLWLDSSDRTLHRLCWGGAGIAALVVIGVLPRSCLAVLWLFYLSLTVAGQEFLGYQWDALLLEAGLLGVFFAPGSWCLDRAKDTPSRGVIWLIRWLVFRLMFLSGLVKLTSGDAAWRAWKALSYHYETQPLPPWTSWYMHQLPPWFQKVSVGWMFWAELVAPILVFGPRPFRLVAFWSFALLQVMILATGNYGFFNLLTLVLCSVLVEDRDWGRRGPVEKPPPPRPVWKRVVNGAVGAFVVLVTTMEGIDAVVRDVEFPAPLKWVRGWAAPFRSLNSYGLFAIMTTERLEIEVEGSDDGETWKPYRFRWKPGEVGRRPRFTTPHMPRLDWQMWFAAMVPNCRYQPWFVRFELRLLEGSPEVLGLLRENPFPQRPPRYARARLYQYHFTRPGSKDWWTRTEVGSYCPPITLPSSEGAESGHSSGFTRPPVRAYGRSRCTPSSTLAGKATRPNGRLVMGRIDTSRVEARTERTQHYPLRW